MKDFLIMSTVGLFTFLAGILLLKREIRIFKNSVMTKATVVEYYEYNNCDNIIELKINNRTMYTMVVEYQLKDGTTIRAKEQSGSTIRKYKLGTEINVIYSEEKTDMFVVRGDHSRKIILWGMIVVGLALMIIFKFGLGQ